MMRIQTVLAKYSWVAWTLVIVSWGLIGVMTLVLNRPPTKIFDVTVDTPVVVAGELAHFTYSIERNRTCPARIQGFWLNREGEAVVRLPEVAGGYGRVGKVHTPVSIKTPAFYVGPLCYRSHSFHSCENGNYVTVTPDACVQIIAAP